MTAEREPVGITYDRLRLGEVEELLVRRFGWKRVVEVNAGGAKAKPSLYSLGFGRAGCSVDLAGGDPGAIEDWRALGLGGRVSIVDPDPASLTGSAGRWDLAWNFVTASAGGGLSGAIRLLASLAPWVMTVHENGLHFGRPWHVGLHALMGIEWTHGRWADAFPGAVGLAYREAGLSTVDAGFFDAPGWPDPPGPRDIRMHLAGIAGGEDLVEWEAPIVEIYRSGRVPGVLRLLRAWERIQPPVVRMLASHLYFHVGREGGRP